MNVSVRRLPLLILSTAALLIQPLAHGQSVATTPVGYNVVNLPVGSSMRVNTFVQPTAYQGTAASYTNAATSVITVSASSAALTSGTYNQGSSSPIYYLEVLGSGSSQGLIADIISNTASTITVNANLANFGVSGTTSFCIRPHTTLSSLFPVGSGLTANVDLVKIFASNNTSQTFEYTGSGDGWLNTNTFGDGGGQIIYPGQGFIVTVQTGKTVTVMGTVKPGPTIVPLYAGAVNVVGTVNPVVSGNQTLSTYSFPSCLTANVDLVKLFNDDGTLTSPGSYESNGTYMYSSSTFADSDTTVSNPTNAVIVTVQQSKYWTMPSFYTSGN
jgi:hypothetical protein